MTVNIRPTSLDVANMEDLSYFNGVVNLGNGYYGFRWMGRATVSPDEAPAASLVIKRHGDRRDLAPVTAFTIPGNAFITNIQAKALGDLTVATATGGLVVAPTAYGLSNEVAEADYSVVSAQATSVTLAAGEFPANAAHFVTNPAGISVAAVDSGADVEYRIYAVQDPELTPDASAAFTADTVTAAVDTDIIVVISGLIPQPFPNENKVRKAVPQTL